MHIKNNNKKAQGISLNVVIIAAIALLVLVILSVIFMGKMTVFTRDSNDCLKQRGVCMDRECDRGYMEHPSAICYNRDGRPDEYMVCCTEINI